MKKKQDKAAAKKQKKQLKKKKLEDEAVASLFFKEQGETSPKKGWRRKGSRSRERSVGDGYARAQE